MRFAQASGGGVGTSAGGAADSEGGSSDGSSSGCGATAGGSPRGRRGDGLGCCAAGAEAPHVLMSGVADSSSRACSHAGQWHLASPRCAQQQDAARTAVAAKAADCQEIRQATSAQMYCRRATT